VRSWTTGHWFILKPLFRLASPLPIRFWRSLCVPAADLHVLPFHSYRYSQASGALTSACA